MSQIIESMKLSVKLCLLLCICGILACDPPSNSLNSVHSPQRLHYYVGNFIRHYCRDGYVAVGGSNQRICQPSQTWSGTPLRCIRRRPHVGCQLPQNPANGVIDFTYNDFQQGLLRLGSKVSYRCNVGFRLVGNHQVRCVNNEWTEKPTCQEIPRITCKLRPPPEHGYLDEDQANKDTWYFRDVARFYCLQGYRLVGSSNSTCLATGKWSSDIPICKAIQTCYHQSAPQNGAYIRSQRNKQTWYAGDIATFTCNNGYVISGSRTSKCMSNGRWSATRPTCRRTCPHRPTPQHALYEPTGKTTWSVGDEISFVCDHGYVFSGERNSRCLASGRWSSVLPTCNPAPRVTCTHRKPPANGRYILSQQRKTIWHEGDSASFRCSSGFTLSGSQISRCSSTGRWTAKRPTCEKSGCPHRPPPHHGAYAQHQSTITRWSVGDVATYVCDYGYSLTRSNSRCLENGRWSTSVPECHRNPTSAPTCSFPSSPAHGSILTSPPGKQSFSEGEYIQYECHNDYRIEGDGRVGCFGGSWTHVPVCRQITQTQKCILPSYPENGRIRTDPPGKRKFSEGEFIYYECNNNFRVDGDGRVGCYGGRWSYVPACRPAAHCPHRSAPQHGILVGNSAKTVWISGDSVEYQCNSDYNLIGSNHITCQSNGVWSASVPSCERSVSQHEGNLNPKPEGVTCPHRLAPENGVYIQDIFKTIWRPGDIARYRCNPDYVLVGHDYTDCREDGTWRFSVPQCRNGCDRPDNPPFGSVHSLPEHKQRFSAGDTIVYRCQDGYRLQGETRVHCQNHGWASTPTCVYQVTCPHRPAPRNGVYIQDLHKTQWFVGDIARYRCDQGYKMVGHSYIDCLSDGTWRFHVPTCQREDFNVPQTHPQPTATAQAGRCSTPPSVAHSTIHSTPASKRVYGYGDSVEYRCERGYLISGNSRVTCRRSGWSQLPSCRRNGCDRPSNPSNGFLLPTKKQRFSNSDFILYQCNDGYTLQGQARVTCTDNRWSHVPMCRHPCPHRSAPAHGSYASQQSDWLSGDVAEFTCPEGYVLVGQSRSTCQMDGTWQYEVPTCRKEKQTASCRGKCGQVDAGGCGCDYKCSHYFDCCTDFANFCQSIVD